TVLVSILSAVVGGPPLGFLVALAYFAGMWAWKGTTIGGIVLGLKVVRLDGAAVTFPVALVRGLAAAFSVVVLFLGFLWIAWDKDKQGWHDKIAGTLVLKLPRGTPLVCF
ncbi:MAG TPA: RDD family protein, partial [Verrucomicrobiota bacterium]|nr:RDD family protein [Verrucomicrobiota bacterium]